MLQQREKDGVRTLSCREKVVILGTEATEWNLTAADEDDAPFAQARLGEAYEFAGHVEAITQLHLDTRKTEALQLMSSKLIARALYFEPKVVSSTKLKPLAETLEAKTRDICGKLTERPLQEDRDKNETADKPERDENPSSYLAAGGII